MHGYWSIDLEIVHSTASTQLPAFAEAISGIVRALEVDRDGGVD